MRTPQKRSSSRGSHATWSEGDSRTCLHCGKTLRITVDPAIWIHTENGVHTSSHPACGPPWKQPHPSAACGKAPANHHRQEPLLTETPTEPAPDPDPQPDEPDNGGDE